VNEAEEPEVEPCGCLGCAMTLILVMAPWAIVGVVLTWRYPWLVEP
jgi:hypothetical protein